MSGKIERKNKTVMERLYLEGCTIQEAIEKLKSLEEEFGPDIRLEEDGEPDYMGNIYCRLYYVYSRPETDGEATTRVKLENIRKKQNEELERRQYEYLKSKYE